MAISPNGWKEAFGDEAPVLLAPMPLVVIEEMAAGIMATSKQAGKEITWADAMAKAKNAAERQVCLSMIARMVAVGDVVVRDREYQWQIVGTDVCFPIEQVNETMVAQMALTIQAIGKRPEPGWRPRGTWRGPS